AERGLHLQPVLDGGVLELQMAEHVVRLERELLLRPDEVEMAIAGARRQPQFRPRIVAGDFRRKWPRVGRCSGRAHSGPLILACFTSSAHLRDSSSRNAANCCGVLPRASEPSSASRSTTSFFCSVARIARLSFSTTSGGVALGANRPLKVMPCTSGKPAS